MIDSDFIDAIFFYFHGKNSRYKPLWSSTNMLSDYMTKFHIQIYFFNKFLRLIKLPKGNWGRREEKTFFLFIP